MSLSGFSESTINEQNDNPSSIASLVYAGGHHNGYKAPTTREIPQLRLAPLETPPPDEEFRAYLQQLGDFSELEPPAAVPPLESVPSVFNSPDFSLDNPRVFAQVVGTEDIIDYTILLEKISWYIDIVELHLLDNISRASSSFFKVTSQFNDIEMSARKTSSVLANLCASVEKVREFGAHENETLQQFDKLDALKDLSSHLTQMRHFYIAYKECARLIKADVPLAASKIPGTVELLTSPHDLRGVVALAPAIADLDRFTGSVAQFYNDEINKQLLKDLNNHIQSVDQHDTLLRIGRILHVAGTGSGGYKHQKHQRNHSHGIHQYNNSWSVVSDTFRSELKGLIQAALDNGVLETALAQYKDTMLREIKALVRQSLPQSRDPETHDGSTALATTLRSLTANEFESILKTLYTKLSEAFRRISTQSKLLLDLCSSLGHPPQIGNLLEMLITNTDSRLAKVLKVRQEIIAEYSVGEFMRVYSLCGIFMSECESICGIYAPELSAYLASQTDLYMRDFSAAHFAKIISALDSDAWKKEELPPYFQTMVDLLVESGDQDPVIWLKQWRTVIDPEEPPSEQVKKLPQNVFIKDSSYFITRSAQQVVEVLSELLQLVCLLPQTTPELSHQYLELFEIFNSKTRSLILGTGAMTSGSGLKRITFRHLSLAYESLGFFDAILEYSKGCIQRHLQDPTSFIAACEAHHTKFATHRGDIENKFISIMSDKAQSYARSISVTNWSACPPTAANQYMQSLIKDIFTVSRILEDTLNRATSQRIIARIFDIYKSTLLESYTSLRIQNASALENVMKDVTYFRDHIKDVKGAGNLGELLFESMSGFAIPEEVEEPKRTASPLKVVDVNTTVGDVSEADISSSQNEATSVGITPSRYREKALPDPPKDQGNVLAGLQEQVQEDTAQSAQQTPEQPARDVTASDAADISEHTFESEPAEATPEIQSPVHNVADTSEIATAETIQDTSLDNVPDPKSEAVLEAKEVDSEPRSDESSTTPEAKQTSDTKSPTKEVQKVLDQASTTEPVTSPAQKDMSEPKTGEANVEDASPENEANLTHEGETLVSNQPTPNQAQALKPSNGAAGQTKKKKNKKKGKKK